jgi:hypothetical protein
VRHGRWAEAAWAVLLAILAALWGQELEEAFSLEDVLVAAVPMAAQKKRTGLSDTRAVVSAAS